MSDPFYFHLFTITGLMITVAFAYTFTKKSVKVNLDNNIGKFLMVVGVISEIVDILMDFYCLFFIHHRNWFISAVLALILVLYPAIL